VDIVVNSYSIPKDTLMIINVWGLHNSPRAEKESLIADFDPGRFEGRTKLASEYAVWPDYAARDRYGYGAGRRLCPGIHLAERNLSIAKLLWAFDFTKREDFPVDMQPRSGYTEGFLHGAKPFQCDIKLRPGRKDVMMKEFEYVKDILLSLRPRMSHVGFSCFLGFTLVI
jgi:cytochrome P450